MARVVSLNRGQLKLGYRMVEILNYLILKEIEIEEEVQRLGGELSERELEERLWCTLDEIWAKTDQHFRELKNTINSMKSKGFVKVKRKFMYDVMTNRVTSVEVVAPTEFGKRVFHTLKREYDLDLPKTGDDLVAELASVFPYLKKKVPSEKLKRMAWLNQGKFTILSEEDKFKTLHRAVCRLGPAFSVNPSVPYSAIALTVLALWREYKETSYLSYVRYLEGNTWIREVLGLSRYPARDTLSKYGKKITDDYIKLLRDLMESMVKLPIPQMPEAPTPAVVANE